MKYLLLFLSLSWFVGCSTIQQINGSSSPQLLIQYPLPEIPITIRQPPSELYLSMFINEQGSVMKVRFITGSGSDTWDSTAATIISKWQFLPAHVNNHPSSAWIHIRAPILYTRPIYYFLAELACNTLREADSIHKTLAEGKDFTELVLQYSTSPSRESEGNIGKINIYQYPENVRRDLLKLDPGEFTQPLKYGNQYIIFKRLNQQE